MEKNEIKKEDNIEIINTDIKNEKKEEENNTNNDDKSPQNSIEDKENNNKNEIIDINKKTKEDCIMHLLQLPIKENYSFKVIPEKENLKLYDNIKYSNGSWNNIPGLTDFNNPMTGMIDLFSIFFKK